MSARKAYRQRQIVALNAVQIAINRARKLEARDVELQCSIVRRAIDGLKAGSDLGALALDADDAECLFCWRGLADAANMAETMAGMGLGRGEQADALILAAQAALAAVFERRKVAGAWSLTADEAECFEWLLRLHGIQLAACSLGEFDTAVKRTAARVYEAQRGNAARGTVVVSGELGQSYGVPA